MTINMKSLDNVKLIKIKQGTVTITYIDGTRYTTKEDITIGIGYKNENNIPLNDHCL